MPTYKLIGAKANETPDEVIIRCANNLVKAVLASGRSMHCTHKMSGIDIDFYASHPETIDVNSTISHWCVRGKTPLKITFAPHESELNQEYATEDTPCT